ncbi:hypothetical protein E3N88_21147 [Mikania micrantha]|uniref:SWIM-type domain-containing protein n=1 Tax=Mikania micrantha TaxID=192012 RepID=A0A5N6NJG6_9ASTR|nr:hypothetical protein E3N88_21147 [Mikania micrantha]
MGEMKWVSIVVWQVVLSSVEHVVSGRPNKHRVVDLSKRTCSCRRWEITGMPCCHAVAAIWFMATNGQSVGALESWVHPVYTMERWRQVYSFKINPINDRTLWIKTQIPITLTPPNHHNQVGRPKKARKRSTIEIEEMTKEGRLSKKNTKGSCGCGKKGHNKRTCKGQDVESKCWNEFCFRTLK